MGRYRGPKARVSRRLGINIYGTKGETSALEKRPYPPGESGRTRRRGTVSEYSLQLQEKQKARHMYGLNEKQFRSIYANASRRTGITGHNMLKYLELRLDNLIYRSGWAATRPQARQFVSHSHILVNGKRVNIPGYRVSAGDKVSICDSSREMATIGWNRDTLDRTTPEWLEKEGDWEVKVLQEPERDQIDIPVSEQLIVELYSK